MSLKVLKPGLLATIQDLGRYGFQKYGVVVGGALDSVSLRLANLLVGNEEGAAAIEVTMMGTSLQFEDSTLAAITGGDLSPQINGRKAPMWRPVLIRKGAILEFKALSSGCRAYLSVAGGFHIQKVMNSRSTYLRGAIGGHKGRALQSGDRLLFNQPAADLSPFSKTSSSPFTAANWYISSCHLTNKEETAVIRVIKGAEFESFSSESRKQFFNQDFSIAPQSDRMGYRLRGPALSLGESLDMLSEAVTNGTIQVPQNGQPIILLADRQTTGGYPRIAQVISVDLPAVSQLAPGRNIRFQEVTLQEAEQLYLQQEHEINKLKAGISLKMKERSRYEN